MRDKWKPIGSVDALFKRISSACPESEELLRDVEGLACGAGLSSDSVLQSLNRRHKYLVRFVLPVAELTGWPKIAPPDLAGWLAAHLHFIALWRVLDDVLDEPATPIMRPRKILRMLDSLALAISSLTRVGAHRVDIMGLLEATTRAAEEERVSALPLERIWQRAGPYLIVPTELLSSDALEIYRGYLNAMGLGHDIVDLPRDLELGIRTLPVKWFTDLSPDRELRPDLIQNYFWRSRFEFDNAISGLRASIGDRFPIVLALIEDADCYGVPDVLMTAERPERSP